MKVTASSDTCRTYWKQEYHVISYMMASKGIKAPYAQHKAEGSERKVQYCYKNTVRTAEQERIVQNYTQRRAIRLMKRLQNKTYAEMLGLFSVARRRLKGDFITL